MERGAVRTYVDSIVSCPPPNLGFDYRFAPAMGNEAPDSNHSPPPPELGFERIYCAVAKDWVLAVLSDWGPWYCLGCGAKVRVVITH